MASLQKDWAPGQAEVSVWHCAIWLWHWGHAATCSELRTVKNAEGYNMLNEES